MSLPRPLARLAVVVLAACIAVLASAGLAAAHVTVASQDAAPGGYGKVTFRVPNESDTASTVKIRVQIPTDPPLASLSVQPVPGWTATTATTPLDPPVTDDDGNKISEAVSVVEFAADAGGGIAPGQFQEFSLSGGPFPDAASLAFPVVQTYSDGNETAWIDPTVEGQAEPEHPAPVLSLGDPAAAPSSAEPATTAHEHTATTSQPAGVALFLAILALLVAIAGVVLGWRATRRTVSS